MKYLKFIITGILFGLVMSKAEIISWFRIQEMFRFESFHMYGIIGSAVILGVLIVQIIRRSQLSSTEGRPIIFSPKKKSITRYLAGGTIFGLGWALSGVCPGPMFVLVGHGYFSILLVIAGALLGTLAYGMLRSRLPH
ncbi:MAG: DUF6691 family protein [Bacteroidota bacterium]